MTTALREGQWQYRVDKGRFPLPPKIRSKSNKTWVFSFDPVRRAVILFPMDIWQKKVMKAKDSAQLRLEWTPFQDDVDPQGRLTIPKKIKELGKIGRTIQVVSLGDQLMLTDAESDLNNRNN